MNNLGGQETQSLWYVDTGPFLERDLAQRAGIGFPVGAVEGLHFDRLEAALVQAARVDVHAIGIRARDVEALDAAHRAEAMLRHAGVEGVFAEHVLAGEQAEARGRHDQVQESAHAAQRAVAVLDAQQARRVHLETHAAAMTAAAMRHQSVRHGRTQPLPLPELPLPLSELP